MALVLLAVCCVTAGAQSCDAYDFPQAVSTVGSAKVTVAKEPLQQDGDGCPGDAPSCGTRAYLVQGDMVLTSVTSGPYVCVAFYNGKRQTTGWARRNSLESVGATGEPPQFAGNWVRVQGDAAIQITRRGQALYASATATYAVRPDNVRTGGAEGTLVVRGTEASFGETGDRSVVCRVNVRLYRGLLLADDGVSDSNNSACGGMGVTLTGIYRRQPEGKTGKTQRP